MYSTGFPHNTLLQHVWEKNLKNNGYMHMYEGIGLVYTEKEHMENHLYSHRKEKTNLKEKTKCQRYFPQVTHFWSLNSPDAKAGQAEAEAAGGLLPAHKPLCKPSAWFPVRISISRPTRALLQLSQA